MLFIRREADGYRFDGHSTGVEDGGAWGIRYTLVLDPSWRTRSAHVVGLSATGACEVHLELEGDDWIVDGAHAPALAGCRDVDLEASAFTNAFPVNRLDLDVGQRAEAPAAWVRAVDLSVERLEQSYTRRPDEAGRACYDYVASDLDFATGLVYDEFGLIVDYGGLATRFG